MNNLVNRDEKLKKIHWQNTRHKDKLRPLQNTCDTELISSEEAIRTTGTLRRWWQRSLYLSEEGQLLSYVYTLGQQTGEYEQRWVYTREFLLKLWADQGPRETDPHRKRPSHNSHFSATLKTNSDWSSRLGGPERQRSKKRCQNQLTDLQMRWNTVTLEGSLGVNWVVNSQNSKTGCSVTRGETQSKGKERLA